MKRHARHHYFDGLYEEVKTNKKQQQNKKTKRQTPEINKREKQLWVTVMLKIEAFTKTALQSPPEWESPADNDRCKRSFISDKLPWTVLVFHRYVPDRGRWVGSVGLVIIRVVFRFMSSSYSTEFLWQFCALVDRWAFSCCCCFLYSVFYTPSLML